MSITKIVSTLAFTVKSKAPEILIGAGIICGVGAVVSAIASTPKALKASESVKKELDIIHATHERGTVEIDGHEEEYTENDFKKDLLSEYIQGGFRIAKNYIVTLLLLIAFIACILSGFGILKKRHATTLAILASTVSSFDAYREQTRDIVGDDKEREIYYGLEPVTTTETVKTEDGKTKKVKKTEMLLDDSIDCPALLGPYSIRLDSTNPGFRINGGDPLYMDSWLSIIESTLNAKLHMRGHLFLSEVLEELQITPETYPNLNTDIIHQVGWIDGYKDGYIDFGCFRYSEDGSRQIELVRGKDGCCYLSFNCSPILGLTSGFKKSSAEKMEACRQYPEIEK